MVLVMTPQMMVVFTCEDSNACNFGQEGDCEYPEEFFDCNGNCIVNVDCEGVCGGDAVIDDCGECNGNNDCIDAGNLLYVSDINDDGDGNVAITIGYSFEDAVAGFQFDLLTDGVFILESAEGGATSEAGFIVSTNSSGRIVGFSFTGATIPAGTGEFLTLTGTYDTASWGTLVTISAIEDCESDGDPACDADDTRMVLSNTSAQTLESAFIPGCWTVGESGDGSCFNTCEDTDACNFGAEGDCEYAQDFFDCNGNCIVDNCSPSISQIIDIPNDQGGRVYVYFNPTIFDDTDSLETQRVEFYAIERYDDDNWVNVINGAAYNQDEYIYEVTTLADSSYTNDAITFFRVVASMDEGVLISEEASGYSIDNIAPAAPGGFSAEILENDVVSLEWDTVEVEDLDFYAVYRSEDENFIIDEILTQTSNTNFLDNLGECEVYYYSVSAFDIHGNESPLSEFIQIDTCDLLNDNIPKEFALNGCFPNPFNPITTIKYQVAEFSNIRIDIYNTNGQIVKTLINGFKTPGEYSINWNANSFTSGTYFVKMTSGTFTDTQKITLVK